MPIDESIPFVEFPMKIHHGECPDNVFRNENSVKVTMLNCPSNNFRKICAMKVKSTWADQPTEASELTNSEVDKIFYDMIHGKTLPNPMESLQFDFLVENITNIETIYILRHRMASGILGKTSGERDIRHTAFIVPNAIQNSKFRERYFDLCRDSARLYADMLDDKEHPISLMDAREIMPKCCADFIYFSFNLKEIIAFINQRKCSQVQSYLINEVCRQMYELVCAVIPELKDVLSLKCDKRCFWITAPLDKNTRLYMPDKNHAKLFNYNPKNYLYGKTRVEMGMHPTIQDGDD
jgi:thymidylate synthase ThyX